MAAPTPYAFQRQIVRHARGALVVGMGRMIVGAVNQSTKELPSVVTSFARAFELNKLPRDRMRAVNQKIAREAQNVVVNKWRSRLVARTPDGSSKRLSGTLGQALADPGNTAATTDRVISFANESVLGREARHWYRVNYGASGSNYGKGRQARRFVMILNGQTFGSFRDESPPDPISWIPGNKDTGKPKVYWRGRSMYPASHDVVVNENGARAARFLDLGHSYVARNAPKAYETFWTTYLNEKGGRARERLKKVDIHMVGDFRIERNTWTARVRR